MMGAALANKASVATIPAPVRGWNARDALAAMKPTDAAILDNMMVAPGGVMLRGGSITSATGLTGGVGALMTYNAPGQASKLFASTPTAIYDVTSAGPVGAAVALPALKSAAWQGPMFVNAGGAYLAAFNGADPPVRFDGATWAYIKWATIANYPYTLTPSKLMAPCVFGSRLWAIEANSLRAWFKPVGQIDTAPAAGSTDQNVYDQCYDLGSQFRLGGTLVAMGVWTRDGGQGSDDYAFFLTSSGEIALYQGTDPTQTTTWSRVGVFRIAPPLGTRPVIALGADVGILTQIGLLPLSSLMPLTEAQQGKAAITDRISGAFQAAYQANPQGKTWGVSDYPRGGLVMVNVPNIDGTTDQFVQNTLTAAWCRFKGLAATCWGLLGDVPYFGTADGRVVQFDVLNADDGAPISATVLPAFSAFRTAARKRFLMARPLYTGAVGYTAPIRLKVDYDVSRDVLAQPALPASGTPWGSPWGSLWGPIIKPVAQWKSVQGIGLVASVLVSIASRNPFRLDQIDVTFETGAFL